MPNWTYNSCEISGSDDNIAEFLSTIKQYNKEQEEDWYDFTTCNPMPKEFNNLHQGARTIDDVRYDAWYEDEDGVRPMMDMVKDKLMKEYGTYQPIDWQYNNWGTKWGDCQTTLIDDEIADDIRTLHFRFESAWGEPFRLLNDIAIKFNLTIKNTWDIELGNGDGISEYPWTPEDTERIYNQHETELNNMRKETRKL